MRSYRPTYNPLPEYAWEKSTRRFWRDVAVIILAALAVFLMIAHVASAQLVAPAQVYEHTETIVQPAVAATVRTIHHYQGHIGGPLPLGSKFVVTATMTSNVDGDTVNPLNFTSLVLVGCIVDSIEYDNTTTDSRAARLVLFLNGESEGGNASGGNYCRWSYKASASTGGAQYATLYMQGHIMRTFTPTLLTDEISGLQVFERREVKAGDGSYVDFFNTALPLVFFFGIAGLAILMRDGIGKIILPLVAMLAGTVILTDLWHALEGFRTILIAVLFVLLMVVIDRFRD